MLLSGFAKCFVTAPAPSTVLLQALADRVTDAAPTMQPQVMHRCPMQCGLICYVVRCDSPFQANSFASIVCNLKEKWTQKAHRPCTPPTYLWSLSHHLPSPHFSFSLLFLIPTILSAPPCHNVHAQHAPSRSTHLHPHRH